MLYLKRSEESIGDSIGKTTNQVPKWIMPDESRKIWLTQFVQFPQ